MSGPGKHARFLLDGTNPIELVESDQSNGFEEHTEEQLHFGKQVGTTVRAYLDAAKGLLDGKYSHLKSVAPSHLIDPGNVFIVRCKEGTVIRFEKKQESSKVSCGWSQEDLAKVSADLSQNLIRCVRDADSDLTPEPLGLEVQLVSVDGFTQHSKVHHSFMIRLDVTVESRGPLPKPPNKPFCAASIPNSFKFLLHGELVDVEDQSQPRQPFLTRTELRFPFGWDCIEIFPFTHVDQWKPEYAATWAENDILAAIVNKQFAESRFQSLDSRATARKKYTGLLNEFKACLDSSPEREEVLQGYLRSNPFLLCPAHTKIWPKLALGNKITDFVFRNATSDYLLVELEKSIHTLFRKDGHPKNELIVAMGQITDWKRYIADNLKTVQAELGLTGLTPNPCGLVVIGRAKTLSAENIRKIKAMESEHPKLRIMTYDDVYDNAKAVIENLLGPLWDPGGATQVFYI